MSRPSSFPLHLASISVAVLCLAVTGARPLTAQESPSDLLSDDLEDQAQSDPAAAARQARTDLANARHSQTEGEKLEKKEQATTDPAQKKALHDKTGKAYSEAFKGYQSAVKLDPRLTDAWIGLGELMSKSGHFDQAIQAFDKALEQKADALDALIGKGHAQLASFKVSEAQATYETIEKKSAKAGREFVSDMRAWLEAVRGRLGPEMHDAVESLDAWIKEREK